MTYSLLFLQIFIPFRSQLQQTFLHGAPTPGNELCAGFFSSGADWERTRQSYIGVRFRCHSQSLKTLYTGSKNYSTIGSPWYPKRTHKWLMLSAGFFFSSAIISGVRMGRVRNKYTDSFLSECTYLGADWKNMHSKQIYWRIGLKIFTLIQRLE